MRSVFAFLRETTEKAVDAYLDSAYPGQRNPWVMLVDNDPYLWIDHYRDGPDEIEPEVWAEFLHRFGGKPDVSLVADVTGRHTGGHQAQEFLTRLLGRFNGVAMDDYTDHLWSKVELQSGDKVRGHTFFDSEGWFAEEQIEPSRDN